MRYESSCLKVVARRLLCFLSAVPFLQPFFSAPISFKIKSSSGNFFHFTSICILCATVNHSKEESNTMATPRAPATTPPRSTSTPRPMAPLLPTATPLRPMATYLGSPPPGLGTTPSGPVVTPPGPPTALARPMSVNADGSLDVRAGFGYNKQSVCLPSLYFLYALDYYMLCLFYI